MTEFKKLLVFDTETTGIPGKGKKWESDYEDFPRVVQLAWVYNGKEYSYIIKPEGWSIPPETTAVHGITQEQAERDGVLFEEVADRFFDDCKSAKAIVAHNIYFDTSIIKAMVLHCIGREYYDANVEDALTKEKRIDTMRKTIKFVGAKYPDGRVGKFPRLEELYDKLFPGESFPAHDALEDVRAVVRCLPPLAEQGIIELPEEDQNERVTQLLNDNDF